MPRAIQLYSSPSGPYMFLLVAFHIAFYYRESSCIGKVPKVLQTTLSSVFLQKMLPYFTLNGSLIFTSALMVFYT